MTPAGRKIWRAVAQCLFGSVALALLTFVCFQLRLDLATTAFLYLIVIVLLSLQGSFLVSAGLSLIAGGCLAYYFTPPILSFRVDDLRGEAGALIAFLTTAAVVTHLVSRARKLAEEALSEIEERKRAEEVLRRQAGLLDLTHDTVFSRDLNDAITYWNRGAEELYGWTREEASGKVSHELMKTAFPAPLAEINAELFRTGRWEGELKHTKRDGAQVVVASRWSFQRDDRLLPIGILETNNDITERKEAENALRRQANLLEQTHDAIIVWEFAGAIIFWNPGAERLYGFSREEAIGRQSHELLQTVHTLPTPVFEAELERDGEWKGELTHTVRDGRTILVESRHMLIREADGRRLVLETNRDITERKRAEAALRQAQTDLAHVSRVTTMGELTASLAHEVNQPIAAALTNANTCLLWLDRAAPNIDEARAATMRIVQDGTRAAEIISRIRRLFKKEAPQREWVDLNEVIREMMVLLRSEAARYAISVRAELAADLPQVIGDRVQLQQVMMNLMMNGIDAMKDVDGTRELSIASQPAENEHLLVSVTDTGVGLPPQQADQIFDAFFTTKVQGTGMGLSISRSIVESHGGRLWASDNASRGASFHLTLPTTVEAHE